MHYYHFLGLLIQSNLAFNSVQPLKKKPVRTDLEIKIENSKKLIAIKKKVLSNPNFSKRDWFFSHPFNDGGVYLLWENLFEFYISPNGRHVLANLIKKNGLESFEVYFLAQILSFVFLKRGKEVTHATVVNTKNGSFALLGPPGRGKSTLAAAFLKDGEKLITDDLLVLNTRKNQFLPQPSTNRIKLFPSTAKKILGNTKNLGRLNPGTKKLIIPTKSPSSNREIQPICTFFVLDYGKKLSVKRLSPKNAALSLIQNTFNPVLSDPKRLKKQLQFSSKLAEMIPFYKLSYPRSFSKIQEVTKTIRGITQKPKLE